MKKINIGILILLIMLIAVSPLKTSESGACERSLRRCVDSVGYQFLKTVGMEWFGQSRCLSGYVFCVSFLPN